MSPSAETSGFGARSAVVTGASNGIGRAISVALAASRMDLWLAGRDEKRLDATAATAISLGSRARVIVADFERDDDIAALVEVVNNECEQLDVLVHAAGVARADDAGSAELPLAAHHAVNTRAPRVITAAVQPLLLRARGMVVVVNSVAALRDSPGFTSYAASKVAAKSWADALRVELAGRGVRVCSLFPGQVATDMQRAIYAHGGDAYEPDRLLQPADIAAVVAFMNDHPQMELTEVMLRSAQGGYVARSVSA